MKHLYWSTFAMIIATGLSFMDVSYAQITNPETDQTDQSEEDWRNFQKRPDTTSVIDGILNRRNVGVGNSTTGPVNPMESLPEDSRRHIKKERARVMATYDPGNIPDVPYTPSVEAKFDPDLADQEKAAWDAVMKDLKGESPDGVQNSPQAGSEGGFEGGSSTQGLQSQGQVGQGPAGQSGQGQGQAGQFGQGQSGDGGSPPSPTSVMRGGSSDSVADILSQIKGMKSGTGAGQASGTQSPSQQGQAKNGTSHSNASNGARGIADNDHEKSAASIGAESVGAGSVGAGSDTSDARNSSGGSSTASNDGSDGRAMSDARESAATSSPEPIGPLERIKRRDNTDDGRGNQTSAYDFLNKSGEDIID